jgi:hypothetical protein
MGTSFYGDRSIGLWGQVDWSIPSIDIYGDSSRDRSILYIFGDRPILSTGPGRRSILWGGAMDAAGMNPRTLALFGTGPIRKSERIKKTQRET